MPGIVSVFGGAFNRYLNEEKAKYFFILEGVAMDNLNERMNSALDLLLGGCRLWAEVQYNQRFLNELKNIKEEFQRISSQVHDEETVNLVEKMTLHLLSDLDWAIKDIGMSGLQIEGTKH